MKLSLEEARAVAVDFLTRHGMPADHAGMVADHLVYATLAGHDFAGLSRLPPIAKMLAERGAGGTITTQRETATSARMDGANVNGYVTSLIAMDKAVALARTSGVGVVGLNNSWFSGMLRYYVERAAEQGLVAMHACNSTARVAPHGAMDRIFGTNPIAFAFPSHDDPLVVDFATASLMWGDAIYHQQTGRPLPEGRAVDAHGQPTLDPAAAMAGAFLPWGGARGSALSTVVQALGILGGSDPVIGETGKWGYFFLALDPALFMPLDDFRQRIGSLRTQMEAARPAEGQAAVRAPGSSAARKLREGRERGWIEVDDAVYRAVTTATPASR